MSAGALATAAGGSGSWWTCTLCVRRVRGSGATVFCSLGSGISLIELLVYLKIYSYYTCSTKQGEGMCVCETVAWPNLRYLGTVVAIQLSSYPAIQLDGGKVR